MKEVDWTKEVITSDGWSVEVLRTGINNPHFPVACLVTNPDGGQLLVSVGPNGGVFGYYDFTIINKPPAPAKFTFNRWAVVYMQVCGRLVCDLFDSQTKAQEIQEYSGGVIVPFTVAGVFQAK